MHLPVETRQRIEERASEVPFAELKRAAAAMSDAYREGRAPAVSPAAYLVTRMPATYAATYSALRELPEGLPPVETILDIGAGTGAASLAARAIFPNAKIEMMERDAALAKEGRAMVPGAELIAADAARVERFPERDLVIAAYSLGEIGGEAAQRMWRAARVALLIVEPGTPKGFALIRAIRQELLAAGAHMAAPCPGAMACPMADPDWCHFAARVERSSLHRRLKGGELGYEDEKYSYVAFTRAPLPLPGARIVRRPQHHQGWIELQICTETGLKSERVSKRDREAFRAARRAAWGGRFDRMAGASLPHASPPRRRLEDSAASVQQSEPGGSGGIDDE
jgi:ribosomal protein RSM22 (predicted rRNA methylase)